MKVAIIGSRTFNDYNFLKETLEPYIENITMIISGGADGADSLAEKWAKKSEKDIMIYNPKWSLYGKRAGYIRNKKIVENCDALLAFWDGKSKGTKSSLDLCEELEVPYKVVRI